MPSLIYIARIRSLSEELAQSLRSAGCHVESFKPGDITQDECLLAMTPEAAEAALHPKHAATESGRSCANVPAAGMTQQSGRDAAVWDCLKTAIAKELRLDREPPAPAVSAVQPRAKEFTCNGKEAASADSSPQGKVNKQGARIEPPPIVAVSSPAVPGDPVKFRPAVERRYRVLRNPLSTVVAVLVFAVVYRGLPSIAALPGRMAGPSTSGLALSVDPPRGTVQRVQRRLSPDDVVAQDFTRHLATQTPSAAGRKNLDLKQAQRVSTQKRIVMD